MGNDAKIIWNASDYNDSNTSQQRDADQLMGQILQDGTEDVKIIVDIGCGSGNITQQLSKRITHKKIYAFDFDPQMIEYAENNHKEESIEYFVQDAGLPWDKLDDRLRALEGKVDIVWSNRVLHFVRDKTTAAETITRLLKPGGRCYVNVTILRDPFEYDKNSKEKYEKFYVLTTLEEQVENYKFIFKNSGLSQVNIEALKKYWMYDSEKQMEQMGSPDETVWNFQVNADCPEDVRLKLINEMDKASMTIYYYPHGVDPNNDEPENKFKIYYEQGRIIGRK